MGNGGGPKDRGGKVTGATQGSTYNQKGKSVKRRRSVMGYKQEKRNNVEGVAESPEIGGGVTKGRKMSSNGEGRGRDQPLKGGEGLTKK